MFEKYVTDRESEQWKIEKTVVTDTTADDKRTMLSLSLTKSTQGDDGGTWDDNSSNHLCVGA